jgi:hypothetical protein
MGHPVNVLSLPLSPIWKARSIGRRLRKEAIRLNLQPAFWWEGKSYAARRMFSEMMMGQGRRMGIAGCRYVGLVRGACLVHLVVCVDKDEEKVAGLRADRLPSTSRASRSWMSRGFADALPRSGASSR